MLAHLRVIEERLNESVAYLYKVPQVTSEIQGQVGEYFVLSFNVLSISPFDSHLNILLFIWKTMLFI